jgi:hypothetical protein
LGKRELMGEITGKFNASFGRGAGESGAPVLAIASSSKSRLTGATGEKGEGTFTSQLGLELPLLLKEDWSCMLVAEKGGVSVLCTVATLIGEA